jgi:FHA domain-containing protein/TIR domain-containing protein/tetratricopeptide repeat protein
MLVESPSGRGAEVKQQQDDNQGTLPPERVLIFFSYARRDQTLRDHLENHLSILKYRGLITTWHAREISAGQEIIQEIDIHLHAAHIILLLISANFLASEYCASRELLSALERHERGEAHVIPVLLRPVLFTGAPFAKLQPLPTNGKPVTRWSDRDLAFVDIARSIEQLVLSLRSPKIPPLTAGERQEARDTRREGQTEGPGEAPAPALPTQREKCPFCLAEIRAGDNFCLNCGNRLSPGTAAFTPTQAQPEAPRAAPDDWHWAASMPASGPIWSDGGATILEVEQQAAYDPPAPTLRADVIEQPARFILHSETGEVLDEYPLKKLEMSIGRATTSDILLLRDKLTSRRHATVRYENGHYVLRDERSANGTFVNGQQLAELTPHILQDGDRIGIGEHELVFRAYGSPSTNVEDLPTIAVPFNAPDLATFKTGDETSPPMIASADYSMRSMETDTSGDASEAVPNQAREDASAPFPAPSLYTERALYYLHALDAYEHALQENSDDADALRGKGNALVGLGRYEEALVAFEHAVALSPQAATSTSMGNVLAALWRYEEAVAAYEQALQLNGNYAPAYAGLSEALSWLGRTQEAEQASAKAKQLGEED